MKHKLRECGVIFFLLALWGLVNSPALGYFSSAFWGGVREDPGIYVWLVRDFSKNLGHLHFSNPLDVVRSLFDSSMLYPFGQTRALSDNFLLPSVIGLVLSKVLPNQATVFNSLLLGAMILNGYVTYRLASHLGMSLPAAVFCGASFMLSPALRSHLGHPQLQFAFFLPLSLLYCFRFAEERSSLTAFCLGICVLGAFLCSVYYALFICLLSALCFLSCLALRWYTLRPQDAWRFFRGIILPTVILYLFARPYLTVAKVFGGRHLTNIKAYSAQLVSYLSSQETSLLWGLLTQHWSHHEAYLYPGLIILCLAIYELFLIRLSSKWLIPLGVLFGIFGVCNIADSSTSSAWVQALSLWIIALCLFSQLLFRGLREKGSSSLHSQQLLSQGDYKLTIAFICFCFFFCSLGVMGNGQTLEPSMFGVTRALIPGFHSLRATGRFGIVAILLLCLLAGFALSKLLSQNRRPYLLLAILLCFLGIDSRHIKFPLVGEEREPAAFRHLESLDDKGAVLCLPLGSFRHDAKRFAHLQTECMRWVQFSGNHPTINGYTGKIPQFHKQLGSKLQRFPDAQSIDYLSRILGLRFILVNPREFKETWSEENFRNSLSKFSDQLRVITKDQAGVYLLEFSPLLSLGSKEVYAPPSPLHSRQLSFEAKSLSPATLEVDSGSQVASRFSIGEQWRSFVVTLPESKSWLVPQKIRFVAEGSPVQIQNLSIDTPNGPN